MPKASAKFSAALHVAGEGKHKEKRQLHRQGSNSNASKLLRDNFKGWGTDAVDLRLRGTPPMSLRDSLIQGLRLSKAGDPSAPVYGKIYYDSLKVKYRDEDDPLSMIELEQDAMVRPLCLKAVMSTKKRTRDFTFIVV